MINKINKVLKMIRISYSPNYAMKVANDYWQNTDITHGSMDKMQFDFYYNELVKIMNSTKEEKLLDYGGGNGEIAYRFVKNGFNMNHCDLSKKMVQNAINNFNLNSCICDDLGDKKYNKILFHNAFFYIHPKMVDVFLDRIYSKLEEGGKLFITDTPDFEKRKYLDLGNIMMILTNFFPVYQIDLAGFFVKNDELIQKAEKVGFKNIIKKDSWCDYRSHWILEKQGK